MVKFIIGGIVFALILIAIIVMVVINFSYRGFKKIREEVEENYYRNQKMKEQKEKNPFGDDYFKSSTGSKQGRKQASQYEQKQQARTSYSGTSESSGTSRNSGRPGSSGPTQQQDTARRTTTSSGVTIIDDRKAEAKRKIFEEDEGEYVEFEEI